MIDKKTTEEIKILAEGGHILAEILNQLGQMAVPGMTGVELDKQAEKMIRQAGARPSFKNFKGFPASLCVSINQTVVHGIPTNSPLKEGDIVGLDLGIEYRKLYTDSAVTVGIGKIEDRLSKFLEVTKGALDVGIKQVSPGNFIGDIGKAIEKYVRPFGYSIVRDLAGHGVGRGVHEEPLIPNYDPKTRLQKIVSGMVLAIEPMLILGSSFDVVTGENNWDVISADNSPTAHFEHTVAVTDDGFLILTK